MLLQIINNLGTESFMRSFITKYFFFYVIGEYNKMQLLCEDCIVKRELQWSLTVIHIRVRKVFDLNGINNN